MADKLDSVDSAKNNSKEGLEFTFSDIPVLQKDKNSSGDFSFEHFNEGKQQSPIHIHRSHKDKNGERIENETDLTKVDATHALPKDLVEVKDEAPKKKQRILGIDSKYLVGMGLFIVILLSGGVIAAMSGVFDSPPPPVVAPPKTPVKTPPPAVVPPENSVKNDPVENDNNQFPNNVDSEIDADKPVLPIQEDQLDKIRREVLLPDFSGGRKLMALSADFLAYEGHDVERLMQLQNLLLSVRSKDDVITFFDNWKTTKPQLATPYYMAALLRSGKERIDLMQEAISRNLIRADAFFEVGVDKLGLGQYSQAIDLFDKVLTVDSRHKEAALLRALAKVYSNIPGVMEEYQMFLASLNLSEVEVAKNMFELGLKLADPSYAGYWFDILSKKCDRSEIAIFRIQIKSSYATLVESDFENVDKQLVMKEWLIFLMTENRISEILSMPSNGNRHIEFWKVYIAWRMNSDSWSDKALALYWKDRKNTDQTYARVLLFLFKQISMDDMLSSSVGIPPEGHGLFYVTAMDYYLKNNNKVAAEIIFRKGKKVSLPNPYLELLNKLGKSL